MSVIKALTPVLALAASAYAQSTRCSTSATYTVTNSADVASISSCSTFTGAIAIATGATEITFDDLEALSGDLIVEPMGDLTSLSAPNLETIDGTLSLVQLESLATVDMPELTRVDELVLAALGPNFLQLGFGSLKQITMLNISDTQLQNLDGISLTTADTVDIVINRYLNDLTLQLKNTTGPISIRGNPSGLSVKLDQLVSCDGLIVNNCASVSFASLVNSTDLISFNENTFTALSLPNLTLTAGLTVADNSALSNISLPKLLRTGSLNVVSNYNITGNLSFPALTRTAGGVVINGSFTGVEFPNLTIADATFDIHSTEVIADTCSTLLNLTNVFSIDPTCGPTSEEQQQSNSTSSGDNGGGKKNLAAMNGARDSVYTYAFGTALVAVFALLF